jgi:hypothetical protein
MEMGLTGGLGACLAQSVGDERHKISLTIRSQLEPGTSGKGRSDEASCSRRREARVDNRLKFPRRVCKDPCPKTSPMKSVAGIVHQLPERQHASKRQWWPGSAMRLATCADDRHQVTQDEVGGCHLEQCQSYVRASPARSALIKPRPWV